MHVDYRISPHAYDLLGPTLIAQAILVMIMVVIALANRYVLVRA